MPSMNIDTTNPLGTAGNGVLGGLKLPGGKGGYPFIGQLENIRLYNRVLSQEELALCYGELEAPTVPWKGHPTYIRTKSNNKKMELDILQIDDEKDFLLYERTGDEHYFELKAKGNFWDYLKLRWGKNNSTQLYAPTEKGDSGYRQLEMCGKGISFNKKTETSFEIETNIETQNGLVHEYVDNILKIGLVSEPIYRSADLIKHDKYDTVTDVAYPSGITEPARVVKAKENSVSSSSGYSCDERAVVTFWYRALGTLNEPDTLYNLFRFSPDSANTGTRITVEINTSKQIVSIVPSWNTDGKLDINPSIDVSNWVFIVVYMINPTSFCFMINEEKFIITTPDQIFFKDMIFGGAGVNSRYADLRIYKNVLSDADFPKIAGNTGWMNQ